MSTIKVNAIQTVNGTGNITLSNPVSTGHTAKVDGINDGDGVQLLQLILDILVVTTQQMVVLTSSKTIYCGYIIATMVGRTIWWVW